MQVILLEDITGLGSRGTTVTVKAGYARNFLIPRGKALPATDASRRMYEQLGRQRSTRQSVETARLEALAAKIAAVSVETRLRLGEDGKAFGSVTKEELAELLAQAGVEVDRHLLELPEPLRHAGAYEVAVHLSPEIRPAFKVLIKEAKPAE